MIMNRKEHLLYFLLQGKISLSSYDYKFMTNLQTILHQSNRITSNQAKLFDTLIRKYNKQLFTKLYPDTIDSIDMLLDLPWNATQIDSTPEYTSAHVALSKDNETITIRVPFKKSFISTFRDQVKHNTFVWDKEQKQYIAPFSTSALKIAYTHLPKHFETVRYSADLSDILNKLKLYEAEIWDPTLVKIRENQYVVAACNSVLHDILPETLALDVEALYKLSSLGVNIDKDVMSQLTPELIFAAQRFIEVDINDMSTVATWLTHSIYKDHQIVMTHKYSDKKVDTEIARCLEGAGLEISKIEHIVWPRRRVKDTDDSLSKKKIYITTNIIFPNVMYNRVKTVIIKNSRSISIQ